MLRLVELLESCGPRFCGGSRSEAIDFAIDWIDNGFDEEAAYPWCRIGVWEPSVAAAFRDSGASPDDIEWAAELLLDAAGDQAARHYGGGCPIYCACLGGTDPRDLIALAQERKVVER